MALVGDPLAWPPAIALVGLFAVLVTWPGRRCADQPANLYQPRAEALGKTPEVWALVEREGLLGYWRESGNWPDFCAREPVCPRS